MLQMFLTKYPPKIVGNKKLFPTTTWRCPSFENFQVSSRPNEPGVLFLWKILVPKGVGERREDMKWFLRPQKTQATMPMHGKLNELRLCLYIVRSCFCWSMSTFACMPILYLENTSSTNGCGVSCGGFPSIQPRLAKAKMSFWQRWSIQNIDLYI